MPTYEYECKKCGKRFERYQSIKARPLSKCPDCGGKAKRLISAGAGIIFKGSGFYETDYKRKKTPPKENKKEDKGEAGAPEKKQDSPGSDPKEKNSASENTGKDKGNK